MAKEIERKFLVRGDRWKAVSTGSRGIRQGYLALDGGVSLRVRIIEDSYAVLTIKSGYSGLARDEFEYTIPLSDGREMMECCDGRVIEKTRYHVPHHGFVWEVDVYAGSHAGLVIAEVELNDETDNPPLPDWVGREITGEAAWGNAMLAIHGLPAGVADRLKRKALV